MNRKPRSDSATAAVTACQNAAAAPLTAPAHVKVPARVRPFFDALLRNRPRDRWNDADLAVAALLARSQCDCERLMREIEAEGEILPGNRVNQKCVLVDKLARRITSLSRLLHVHAEATQGRAREQGNALDAERAAEAAQVSAGNVHHLIPRRA